MKDGNAEHITREPEQVKAFRDTWRDGIHSYLTYLRDRLTVARDLLSDSGSIFVQIGDENVHRVRTLMDEVFGTDNFVSAITVKKTAVQTDLAIPGVADFILWFCKNKDMLKYRQYYLSKDVGEPGSEQYRWVKLNGGRFKRIKEQSGHTLNELCRPDNLTSSHEYSRGKDNILFEGVTYSPNARYWSTSPEAINRLGKAERLYGGGKTLSYVRFLSDFSVVPLLNVWTDTGTGGYGDERFYVVQTTTKIVQRCILMATDPGDLVLDPTCGSGTTAYVAEQWGRRWITIDTSRVALALARARIMGARYPYYLLADSKEGQLKEAELTRIAPSEQPTYGNIRQGFVYERVAHITLKSIANNTEIDVIWEKYEKQLAPLREQWSVASGLKETAEDWEIPREADEAWSVEAKSLHDEFWELRIERQKEIDASIAAKADYEFLYDKPYEDKNTVRVAGPFTVESLSPHRVLGVGEDDELIDQAKETTGDYGKPQTFADMILENLRTAGVQQAHKEDKINFISLTPWPGHHICAEGRFEGSDEWLVTGGKGVASGEGLVAGDQKEAKQTTKHKSQATKLYRAGILVGPEFGTVCRADLVAAAREAGDADFDVLITCAFNYDAQSSEFDKLGRVPVLKARMNADLHMAEDLKNTGKGNLFVIFGEPDVEVVCGQWLVAKNGRMIALYESCKELSGLGSLEEINRLGGTDLPRLKALSSGGALRSDQPDTESSSIGSVEYRRGSGKDGDGRVPPVSKRSKRVVGGSGDATDPGDAAGLSVGSGSGDAIGAGSGDQSHVGRTQAVAAIQALKPADFPLSLTTDHLAQVTIHGVDVFKPQTGKVESSGPDDIACWFIDTEYNEESFFVRHAYFLGQNDPYKSLKTTLKAEINEEAWESLHSAVSRPFNKPENSRIAVKVINHLGDEVMKVFRV